MISIIIPTYGRADRIEEVAKNVHDNTLSHHELLFVYEADDKATEAILSRIDIDGNWFTVRNHGPKNYAGAIQSGFDWSLGRYVFLGADDLRFDMGWDGPALKLMVDPIKVVGTNDLGNTEVMNGEHATHYLVDRRYISDVGGTIDGGPGSFLHPGYDHNYTDTEFIGVAKSRGVFAPCLESIVEHKHFSFGKSRQDSTYTKGYAKINQDAQLFAERVKLWS